MLPIQKYLNTAPADSPIVSKKEDLLLQEKLLRIASFFDNPPIKEPQINLQNHCFGAVVEVDEPVCCVPNLEAINNLSEHAIKQFLNAVEQYEELRNLMSLKRYSLSERFADQKSNAHLCEMLSGLRITEEEQAQRMTPLHMAINSGSKELVANLLQLNANGASFVSLTARFKDPETGFILSPTSLAVARGEIECFDLLIQYAKESLKINEEDIAGVGNLLHLAILLGKTEMLEHLLTKYIGSTKRLINQKQQHPLLFTPIHLAAVNENLEALFLLGAEGANLENTDHKGQTPLHHAVMNENKQVVDLLLFFGAKTTTRDLQGQDARSYLPKNAFLNVDAIESSLSNAYVNEKALKQSPPNFYKYPPKNLVFQGGGAKGPVHIGGLHVLENRGVLSNVERVAGTSAGAITATFLALGYTVDEIQKLLMKTELIEFLDFMKPSNSWSKNSAQYTNISHFPDITQLADSVLNHSGLCKGKVFRRWMAKLIEKKTGIKYFTFGDLRKLVKSGNGNYKHLHAFATQIRPKKKITHFNSEEKKWDEYIIADTIRLSMGIPGVFDAQFAYYRDDDGHRHSYKDKFYVDGGVIYNLPVEAFDRLDYTTTKVLSEKEKKRPVFNKETLAFSLCDPDDESVDIKRSKPSEPSKLGVLSDAIGTRMHGESILRERVPYNKHRIIKISNMGVGTLEFNLSKKGMKELIESGKEDTEEFLEDQGKFDGMAVSKFLEEKDEPLATLISRYKGKLPINKRDEKGYTALQRSVLKKDAKSIEYLLNHPYMDPNIVNDKDNKMSALLYAISHQKIRIINLLLDSPSININIQDANGQSALHWALKRRDKKSLAILLKHPEIDINLQDQNGRTPLHLALDCNANEILMALLTDPRIDENTKNHNDLTPLQEILKIIEDDIEKPKISYLWPAQRDVSTSRKAVLLILKKFCRLLALNPQEYFTTVEWNQVVLEDLLGVLAAVESDPESDHEDILRKSLRI
ncbi:MAG: hypothetical protein S4CHLAM123_07410 [Chlamydiales bacterium]|nr:hypothetical protein [Chlamydiales bacterium]